jgi:MYXO-CTERM domain-containing protein
MGVMRPSLAVPASLLAGVAASMTIVGPAAAYVPYPTDSGNIFHWPQRSVPMVAYPNDFAGMMPIDETLGALDASAAAWSAGANPCTDLQISVTSSADETPRAKVDSINNIIFRTTSWCKLTDTGACDPDPMFAYDPAALALTSVSAGTVSGNIRDVDMEVNGFGPVWGDLVMHPELQGMSIHDLQNAVTHEMGHVIGLDHTCYLEPPPLTDNTGQPTPDCAGAPPDIRATTMFPSAYPGDTEKRTLEADDKLGLCEIYPAPGDGCGCATTGARGSGAGVVLALAAALAALRARRRRRT